MTVPFCSNVSPNIFLEGLPATLSVSYKYLSVLKLSTGKASTAVLRFIHKLMRYSIKTNTFIVYLSSTKAGLFLTLGLTYPLGMFTLI